MKTRIDTMKAAFPVLLIAAALLVSGCYTQLARPTPERTEVVEEYEEYYPEEGEEYGYDEEYTVEDEYGDVHVTRTYYHDRHIYRYGYYADPWFYDPFFDPYYYDPYFYDFHYPYSSHVSVHIGFYDPFYFSYHYYPWSYRYHRARYAFFFGGGCYRPFRYSGYVYAPVYVDGARPSQPFDRRGFTGRGSTRDDDFGYRPTRTSVNGGSSNATPSNGIVHRPTNPNNSGRRIDKSDLAKKPDIRKSQRPERPSSVDNTTNTSSKPKPSSISRRQPDVKRHPILLPRNAPENSKSDSKSLAPKSNEGTKSRPEIDRTKSTRRSSTLRRSNARPSYQDRQSSSSKSGVSNSSTSERRGTSYSTSTRRPSTSSSIKSRISSPRKSSTTRPSSTIQKSRSSSSKSSTPARSARKSSSRKKGGR